MASEDALLQQVAGGDRAAFDRLVEQLAPPTWTLLRRLTADEARAEDALQETFLAVWRGASGHRHEGSARAWVFGLARRQAARTWRRRAGEPATTESLVELAKRAGWGDDPESLAARAEDRQTLRAALDTLRPASRDLVSRCDLEGFTPSEVAAELGIAPGTVRVRLHRARLELMAALRPESPHA